MINKSLLIVMLSVSSIALYAADLPQDPEFQPPTLAQPPTLTEVAGIIKSQLVEGRVPWKERDEEEDYQPNPSYDEEGFDPLDPLRVKEHKYTNEELVKFIPRGLGR